MAMSPFNGIEKGLMQAPDGSEMEGANVVLDEPKDEAEADYTIEEDEDGGAVITYGSSTMNKDISSIGFGDNLAEVLEPQELKAISNELIDLVEDDDESRAEWKKIYEEGLNLLGLKYDERTEPFEGSTGVTHPILNEAVTQFQAQAYKEMLPSNGPVRTQILGSSNPVKEQQAERVKDFLNYYITVEMEEYDPDYDQMLYYLGYGGSTFKKVYRDGDLGRAVSPYVLPKDLIVPYGARDLATAERVTHVLRVTKNDLRKQQVSGFYRDIEQSDPDNTERDVIEEKIDTVSGIEPGSETETDTRTRSTRTWTSKGSRIRTKTATKPVSSSPTSSRSTLIREMCWPFAGTTTRLTPKSANASTSSTTSSCPASVSTGLALFTCWGTCRAARLRSSVSSSTLEPCQTFLRGSRPRACASKTRGPCSNRASGGTWMPPAEAFAKA